MRIIPVLDVMSGQVVRAVGGRRAEYRPIRSRLTASIEPVKVAQALIDTTGAAELYVADLDAITRIGSNRVEVCELARRLGATVWFDSGVTLGGDLATLSDHRLIRPVVGTETVIGPDVVWSACQRRPPAALSLDLRGGRLVGDFHGWHLPDATPVTVAERAVREGARTLIVIDLEDVGERRGPTVGDVCAQVRRRFPAVELLAGGGVRNWDDVRRLEDAGADGVLVASALHDGTLTFPRPA